MLLTGRIGPLRSTTKQHGGGHCSMLIMITSSSKRTASQINQSEKKGQPSTFSSGVATHPSIRRRGLQPTRLALFPP